MSRARRRSTARSAATRTSGPSRTTTPPGHAAPARTSSRQPRAGRPRHIPRTADRSRQEAGYDRHRVPRRARPRESAGSPPRGPPWSARRATAAPTHTTTRRDRPQAVPWAAETSGTPAVASSMGDEVLVHLVGTTLPGTDVFFLDTGYHFAETLGTRDAVAAVSDPDAYRAAAADRRRQDAQYGKDCTTAPRPVLRLRKVEPWSALSPPTARGSPVCAARTPRRVPTSRSSASTNAQMVKVNASRRGPPRTSSATRRRTGSAEPAPPGRIASIGCAPCTRPVADGEDPRAGRWSGRAKTECGFHT